MNDTALDHRLAAITGGARATARANDALEEAFRALPRTKPAPRSRRREESGSARPRHRWPQMAAAAALASLLVGGSAYAADKLGIIDLHWSGNHQLMVGIGNDDDASSPAPPPIVDGYRLALAYEPAGLTDERTLFADSIDTPGRVRTFYSDDFLESLSATVLYRDTDEAFPLSSVVESESVSVNGREGLLVTTQDTAERRGLTLILPFETENRIVVIEANATLRSEVLKVAEGISLVADGPVERAYLWLWSDYLDQSVSDDESDPDEGMHATFEEMGNLHGIGDTFPLSSESSGLAEDADRAASGALMATVTDVAVSDSLSDLARPEAIPVEWLSLAREDGSLGPDLVTYGAWGDGVNSVDTVIERQACPIALVQATVEYANASDEPLEDFLVNAWLLSARESFDGWSVVCRERAVPGADFAESTAIISMERTAYFDVEGTAIVADREGGNTIARLEPGEKLTVRFAWLVPRDELGQLLLDVNGDGALFNKTDLASGYVDIRQPSPAA